MNLIDEGVARAGLRLEQAAQSETVQRVLVAAEADRQVPLSFAALALLVALAVAPVWGWHTSRQRDAWWRAEIARSSAQVRATIKAGAAEAIATDDDLIKALGATDAKLHDAETRLTEAAWAAAAQAKSSPDDGCAPIPARCLQQ